MSAPVPNISAPWCVWPGCTRPAQIYENRNIKGQTSYLRTCGKHWQLADIRSRADKYAQ